MIEIKYGSENMCDLLNKEQTELKKAMIEELGHALYCKQDKFVLSNPFDVAKAVVEEGYRKIPEGAVVLTREENEKWLDFLELNIKKARKETAREFVKALKKKLYTNNYCQEIVTEEHIDEIAKQFGVEVEE